MPYFILLLVLAVLCYFFIGGTIGLVLAIVLALAALFFLSPGYGRHY